MKEAIRVSIADTPPMFDFDECRACPKAVWMTHQHYSYSSEVQLHCADPQRWHDKKSVAMEQFYAQRDEARERDDKEDFAAVTQLTSQLSPDLAQVIVRSMWSWLTHAHVVEPFTGAKRGGSFSSCCYYPKAATYFAAAIAAELPPDTASHWNRKEEWKAAVIKYLVHEPPADAPWTQLAAYATIWRARIAYGMGTPLGIAQGDGDVQEEAA